jgi:hypothetical protein
VPAIKDGAGLGDGRFAIAFLGLEAGAVLGLQFGGIVVPRTGNCRALLVSLIAFSGRLLLPALAPGLPFLAASLFLSAALNSVADVPMNAQGMAIQRYVAGAREGRSLAPRRSPGSRLKLDEGARRLLEADLQERPAGTLAQRREFLSRVRGVEVSDSTVSRTLGCMGWSRKKVGRSDGTRRVPEGRLEGARRRGPRRPASGVRRRDGYQHLAGALYARSRRGERAHAKAPRNWGKNITLLASISIHGMGRAWQSKAR